MWPMPGSQVRRESAHTGGLSGATPSEAVSWGKIDPDRLPDAVVGYLDSTIALPIITSYALARHKPRRLKRLYERRDEMMKLPVDEHARLLARTKAASALVGRVARWLMLLWTGSE